MHGDIRGGLVIHPLSIAPVAVRVDEHATAGIRGAQPASLAAKSAKNDRMHDTEPRASQHGDGQLGNHGHVNRHAVARFQPSEIAQQRRGLIHALVQLLIGDHHVGFAGRFGNENDGRLVFVFGEVPVHAVVAGVQFSANEPFPKGRMIGVERGVPILVPVEQFGVVAEALREVFLVELSHEVGIVQVGLANKLRGRAVIAFFFPVHRDLRFTDLGSALMVFGDLFCR